MLAVCIVRDTNKNRITVHVPEATTGPVSKPQRTVMQPRLGVSGSTGIDAAILGAREGKEKKGRRQSHRKYRVKAEGKEKNLGIPQPIY